MVTESIIISQLQSQERNYRPNETVLTQLAAKQLVLLVSPAAVGKSTLMNRIVELDDRFARISGLTSRPARAEDEPGMYRYIPHTPPELKRLLEKAEAGELVQYAIHPTTSFVYATELQDYPKQFNCKDVLGHAIAGFRALPTAGSHTFGIVCDPAEWQQRLDNRYPNPADPELKKRLAEAAINLSWSLQDTETIWIENSNGRLDTAAATIINYSAGYSLPGQKQQETLRSTAQAMLNSI